VCNCSWKALVVNYNKKNNMTSKSDDPKLIYFFESRLRKLKNSSNRELLKDLQELLEILGPGLSDETKDYLDKMLKDSLKQ